jgi:hypothetical protein
MLLINFQAAEDLDGSYNVLAAHQKRNRVPHPPSLQRLQESAKQQRHVAHKHEPLNDDDEVDSPVGDTDDSETEQPSK